jgi:hypothetical protein
VSYAWPTRNTAPELEFLRAKWAAHVSFAAVADLLHDVLPVNACVKRETIRAQVFETAERLESELVCRTMVESTAIEPSGDRDLLRLQAATAIGISTKGVKTLRITVLLRE